MAFVRSPLKTGSAPTPPVEPLVPNFVVELSSGMTSSAGTFTVTNPGLYFLSTGCTTYTRTATSITITSAHLPYVYNQTPASGENAGAFSYMVVDLDAGDIVSFYNRSGHGYVVALRFTNGSYDSVVDTVYDINDRITITPDSDYPCFIFGGVSNERISIYDNSTTVDPESITENDTVAGNTALWRAIGCYGANSATLDISGNEFSVVAGVCIKMANVRPRPTPTFTIPEFNKTLLIDNSSKASSFTLTGDYHDYDFVLIKLNYADINTIETLLVPPSVIDACTTSPFSYITFDRRRTNIYASYNISGNTWTKTYARATDIIEIYGCNCINATVSETEIYYASALSGNATTVEYAGDLTDFDYIFVVCNSGDPTECIVNDTIWTPTKMVNENTFTMNEYTNGGYVINNSISYGDTNGYPMMYYSNSTTVTLTEHELSSARYLYVTGIKFTPN